ncbi:MAG TPA: prenyltransferase [Candidatus Limnocylindrales bacterium]|nr:prenyltransferase [Candidatus Limnocylindrales bacterium]
MEASVPELRLPPLRAFLRLSRPLFLYGGFAGVALGAAVARFTGHRLDAATYVWVQLLVSSFHLMVHYANDYFDRESDATAAPTRWSGGSRVLVDGHLAPRVALVASLVCAGFGFVACARFALTGNPLVAAIGVAIFVFAWLYSAPPVRFAARGLGELDTALVVAVLFPFAAYAAFAGTIDDAAVRAVVAPAAAMIAMMLGVELPDADCDDQAGKRNLVVRWGCARAWQLIAGTAAASAICAVVLALRVHAGFATLALVPQVFAAVQLVRLTNGDPRPASIAFWGVTLYAATVTGLAVVYALAPAR